MSDVSSICSTLVAELQVVIELFGNPTASRYAELCAAEDVKPRGCASGNLSLHTACGSWQSAYCFGAKKALKRSLETFKLGRDIIWLEDRLRWNI